MSPDGPARRTATALVLMGALAALVYAVAFYRTTDWTMPVPRDATTLAAGRDFLNFWMAGRAAHTGDPGQYYDPVTYNRALARVVGNGYPVQTWSYPPTQMLAAAPFGRLPYRTALVLWTLLGTAALFVAGRAVLGRQALTVFAAPAALFCLVSGQSSFFTTALVVGGLLLLERRPMIAGLLFGLMSLKPQLAILVPVLLLAGRHTRALAAAAATALLVLAATTALFGIDVWRDYVAWGVPAQNAVLADTGVIATRQMPTVFMNLHRIGLGYGAAMGVQIAFAVAAAVGVWRTARLAMPFKAVAFLAASVAATPYLMPYDTLPLALAGLWLLRSAPCDASGTLLVKLAWWLPFVQLALGSLSVPGAALIAPCMLLWVLMRHPANTRGQSADAAAACGVN